MTEDRKKEIGERLEEIRISMKLNKREFAVLIGVPNQNLGRIEKGDLGISLDKLISICEKLNQSADYLLFGKEMRSIDHQIRDIVLAELLNYKGEELDIAMEIVKAILNKLELNDINVKV